MLNFFLTHGPVFIIGHLVRLWVHNNCIAGEELLWGSGLRDSFNNVFLIVFKTYRLLYNYTSSGLQDI